MFAVEKNTQKMETRVLVFKEIRYEKKSIYHINFDKNLCAIKQHNKPEAGIYITINQVMPYGDTFELNISGRGKTTLNNLPKSCWTPLSLPIPIEELVMFTINEPCRLLVSMVGKA